jgi:hypothetical protein
MADLGSRERGRKVPRARCTLQRHHSPSDLLSSTRPYLLKAYSVWTHQWINPLIRLTPSWPNHLSIVLLYMDQAFNTWAFGTILYPKYSNAPSLTKCAYCLISCNHKLVLLGIKVSIKTVIWYILFFLLVCFYSYWLYVNLVLFI